MSHLQGKVRSFYYPNINFMYEATLLIAASFTHLVNYCRNIWTPYRTGLILIFMCLFFALRVNDGHVLYFGSSLGSFAFLSLVLSFVIFMRFSYMWYSSHLRPKSVGELSFDEFFCFVYIQMLVIIYLGMFTVLFVFYTFEAKDLGVYFVTIYSYAVTSSILILSIIHSRKTSFEVLKAKVSQDDA